MPSYELGRATIDYISGKNSDPCDNCGTTHATMYSVGLAKSPGEEKNISWTLCVTCRSHLEGVFNEHTEDWDSIFY